MNDRARGKPEFPKGLPVENDLDAIQKNRTSQIVQPLTDGNHFTSLSGQRIRSSQYRSRMIRRAYTEPLGLNTIESILLQRDYIID